MRGCLKKVCEREMVEPKRRVRERVISKREREREREREMFKHQREREKKNSS
jgi:hypothetical protein